MRVFLIALMWMACWPNPVAWAGEAADAEVPFDVRSNRLSPAAGAVLDRLALRLRSEPTSRLLVLAPSGHDGAAQHFVSSRLAVLDHELGTRGLIAERMPAASGEVSENGLRLRIVKPPAALVSPTVPVALLPVVAGPQSAKPSLDRPDTVPAAPSADPAPPALSAKVEELWLAAAGRSLQEVLRDWADKAGWTLVWQSDREYPIDASATFSGDFTKVASQLCEGFSTVAPAPFAHFYKRNQVLVILSGEGR